MPEDRRTSDIMRWITFAPLLLAIVAIMGVSSQDKAGIVPWVLCFLAGGLAGGVVKARKFATTDALTKRVQMFWVASIICSVTARVIAGAMPNAIQWAVIACGLYLPFSKEFIAARE